MTRHETARKTRRARVPVLVVLALASMGVGIYALAAQSLAAPTITAAPANPTNMTSATFTYTHNKKVSFQCSLDGSAFAACGTTTPSTKTYPGPLAIGTHQFQVRATMGTETSPAAVHSWTIDLSAPTVASISRAGSSPTNASSVSWSVAFSEAVSGVGLDDFSLANSGLPSPSITAVSGSGTAYVVSASTGSGSGTLALNLADNDSIKDPASNKLGGSGVGNGNFAGPSYIIDKIPPAAPVFTQTPPDPSSTANATFAWTSSETGAAIQCSKEGGAWFSCASPYSFSVDITSNAQHVFAVRAVDAAGNVASVSYTWKVNKIDFTIAGTVGLLYPGVWRSIDVSITNPNSYAIDITSLTVAVKSSPPGCPGSTNIEFTQSPLSSAQMFTVAAHSTVAVLAADRPLIRLKNLHEPQDVCQNGTFSLTYAGTGTK